MAVVWEKAPQRVVDMAKEIIELYHPWLKQARIGLLFRSKAGSSMGRQVIGRAAKVNDQWRALLGDVGKLHFVIWLAKDWWEKAEPKHKRALVDHELSHCTFGDNGPTMRGHDIEEFNDIIARHGLWRNDLMATARAIQPHFAELEADGVVVALDPNGHEKQASLEKGEQLESGPWTVGRDEAAVLEEAEKRLKAMGGSG